MSAFVLIFNRDGAPVHRDILQQAAFRLGHRGPDGLNALVQDSIGMAYQHFWNTPEEVGEQLPLTGRSGAILVFEGRLDNRSELLSMLSLNSPGNAPISDARLFLHAYETWGEAAFPRLLGVFSAALYDPIEASITLIRDPLGERTLFYALNKQRLVIASEPYAVLAHPTVNGDLDEVSLAHWYALKPGVEDRTLYRDVRELPPAHLMIISRDSVKTSQYWNLEIEQIRYKRDEEYAEHFLSVLADSVRCRLRSSTPPAIQMSGGYDSTSIAAMAAKIESRQIRTVSWTLESIPACDESVYIKAMNQHINAEPIVFSGDGVWPLYDPQIWCSNPNIPASNPYLGLKMRAYQAASSSGSRLMLTGGFGNYVYLGSYRWLVDYLQAGNLAKFKDGVGKLLKTWGLRGTLQSKSLFQVARWLYRSLRGREYEPWREHTMAPYWLTPHSASLLQETDPEIPIPPKGIRRGQYHTMLNRLTTMSPSRENHYAHASGIQLEYPYRDQRMVRLALGLPSDQFFNGARHKYIAFHSLKGMIPEVVRQRKEFTSLVPFYLFGIRKEYETVASILHNTDAIWPRYVKSESITETIHNVMSQESPLDSIVPWTCLSVELWRNHAHINTLL